MERTTHMTLKTPVAEDNNGSAPPAGHGISLPPSLAAVKKCMKHCLSASASRRRACMTKNPQEDEYEFGEDGYMRKVDSARLRRHGHKFDAEWFRKEYTYGSVIDGCISKERKSCIWHGDTFSWQDESSGTMWVGVHGTDSICVVTRSGDLDVTRLHGSLKCWPIEVISFKLRKSFIVETEDLAGRSGKLRRRFRQRIKKPFGVVSVIPDARHVASCVENGEIKATEFLQEKMNSDTVFTVSETIQTAISAFQHLFQKKFKADEIQVSVMDPNYVVYNFEEHKGHKDPTVEEFNILQIKEYLDVINKSGPPCHKEKTEPRPEDSSSGSGNRSFRNVVVEGPLTRCSTVTYEDTG